MEKNYVTPSELFETIQFLKSIDSTTIANAVETFPGRKKTEGFLESVFTQFNLLIWHNI